MYCFTLFLHSHTFLHVLETRRHRQYLYMNAHKHTGTLTLCISIQPCRQQEGETLLPVEEWVEGVVVLACVCMCIQYSVNICVSLHCSSLCLFYYCCPRGYWFISTRSVDTTGFGRSLKLPLGPHVDTTHCIWFLAPVICDTVSGRI